MSDLKNTGQNVNDSGDSNTLNQSVSGTAISLQNFGLKAGDKQLLDHTSIEFPAGKLTLLLGCSGVGKSLLMRILAGLITADDQAIRFSGDILFRNSAGASAVRNHFDHPVAVVFQSYALFDELSPSENIQIAIDHGATKKGRAAACTTADALLNQLAVPTDRPTSVLSGGQQQRLAICRALAMETDVVLYDEPTSGLDPNTGRQVAEMIRETQQKFQRTSVVVTHDFEALSDVADHIILLNHREQKLQTVPQEDWGKIPELLGKPPSAEVAVMRPVSIVRRLLQKVNFAAEATGVFVHSLLLLPLTLLPLWKSTRWAGKMTWHYFCLVAGWSAIFYIAISGMIIGFVAQDFIFRYLPFRQYTEPLLIENLLHATGFSLFRFLVPILSTILIAARSGAAVSADVGSKVYGNQLDAMKTIGMSPDRSMRTPILYAFLIGTPMLTLISYLIASTTSALAFLATHAAEGLPFWDAHFHRELRLPGTIFYKGSGWLMGKLLTCAIGTAVIAWSCGSSPKRSASEISTGVTRTILWSTLFTLLTHFVFSLLEFKAPE